MTGGPFTIRSFRPGDEPEVYDVCLKTGDAGQDASHLYTDPQALGHIYVGPYMRLEPDFAHVLVDPSGICGYALAALDSKNFYTAYVNEWLPEVRKQCPEPSASSTNRTPTEGIYFRYYHPEIHFPDTLNDYPSHLHIDLLPRAQGFGNGTQMMEVLLKMLKERGSPGVHLAVAASNHRAQGFYQKLEFIEIDRLYSPTEKTLYFGKYL